MDFYSTLALWNWMILKIWTSILVFLSVFTWNRLFWSLSIYRYLRLIVNCIAHWTYKSKPIPENATFHPEDVTVIIPTIHNNVEELREALESILATRLAKLILVTTTDKYDKLRGFVDTLSASKRVEVHHVRIANKRLQVCEAIPMVKTKIMVLADDDVTWPRTILPWLLAPFEDPKMGAVGPCQRVKRLRSGPWMARIWNFLGAVYIERRNFEISATHHMDGGTSCMSGRTCAFRSEILQDPLFLDSFKTERWGKYQLNADDDNFVTRWLVSHQYKTWIQYNKECEIETTLEDNPNFLKQCLRWSRSNWRSNWTSLVDERYVWRQQPWSVYTVHLVTFTSLAFVVDPFLVWACFKASPSSAHWAVPVFLLWMLWTKVVKLMGLLIRDPTDVVFLPVSILFGWFHGLIKLYALCTLRVTSWGSRADGDTDDDVRMRPRRRAESIANPGPGQKGLIMYELEKGRARRLDRSATRFEEKFNEKFDEKYDEKYDAMKSDVTNFDATRFDATRFEATRFEATRFDATRFDATNFDTIMGESLFAAVSAT